MEATLSNDHKGTIYSVAWSPTAADAAAASAAAVRAAGGDKSSAAGGQGGGAGGACLATAAGDNALRVFYEEASGTDKCFSLDMEVSHFC